MKKIIKTLIISASVLIVLIFSLISPIDYTPLQDRPFYKRMMRKLDTMHLHTYNPTQYLKVGWSQFSIVPDHPVRMAGYGIRKKFDTVRDSLYVRILAVDNGGITAYFITADLLLFPPAIKTLVFQKLGTLWKDFVFFSASHTHSGVGGWAPSLVGEVLMGKYNPDWVEATAQGIIEHIKHAKSNLKKSTLYTWEADAGQYTYNRALNVSDAVDSKIRGISAIRSDSSKALLFVCSVHPTLLPKQNTALSNDYIDDVFESLAKKYNYIQFMGGMMASQTFNREANLDPLYLGSALASLIHNAKATPLPDSLDISAQRLAVELGPSQLRIAKNWKLRDWVFRRVMGPLKANIAILQIGGVLFLGASCDFSGELSHLNNYDSTALHYEKKLIITSFNGGYTGYITADHLYQEKSNDNEVTILNWVGPYFGEYYTEIITKVIAMQSHSSLTLGK